MICAHPVYKEYCFSDDGRAFRKLRGGMYRELRGCQCGIGYRAVSVPISRGKYKRVYIHRAICEIFNGPPKIENAQCRHLDGNLENNSCENLAWGSPQDNADDMKRHGKTAVGERNPMAILNMAQVLEMRKLREESGQSYKKIAKHYGVSTMTAFRAITGRAWA